MFSRASVGIAVLGMAGAVLGYLLFRAPEQRGGQTSVRHRPDDSTSTFPAPLPQSGRPGPSSDNGPASAAAASVARPTHPTAAAPAAGDRLPGQSTDDAGAEAALAVSTREKVAGAAGEADGPVGSDTAPVAAPQGGALVPDREADTALGHAPGVPSVNAGEWPPKGD